MGKLRRELETARELAEARQADEAAWTARGIVRSVLPQMNAVVITHETIANLMPAMTMAFEAEDPRMLDGLRPGDPIRFTLAQKGDRLLLVAIQREGPR